MFCKNCGEEIDDNAAVCPHCGVLVKSISFDGEGRKRGVNGVGIAGFVLSLLSLFLGIYFCIVPVISLVLSSVGMGLRKRFGSCNGLAIAGLVLSIITVVFWLLMWLFVGSLWALVM